MKRPGQDLLAQARSGVMWLNGDESQGPVPFGLAIGDMLAGAAAAQGILAALVRRGISGKGAHVETSLLEALVDFQFEVLTTYPQRRAPAAEARPMSGARTPICRRPTASIRRRTASSRVAMTPIAEARAAARARRRNSRPMPATRRPGSPRATRSRRSSPRRIATQDDRRVAGHPRAGRHLVRAGAQLARAARQADGFTALDMLQTVTREDDVSIETTRSPIRVDGVRHKVDRAAPRVGEHSAAIRAEFGL